MVCVGVAPEQRCSLVRREFELVLPTGVPCSPQVLVEQTACFGVCGTSFVEGTVAFDDDDRAFPPPSLRWACSAALDTFRTQVAVAERLSRPTAM